jgi:hypothetical protein
MTPAASGARNRSGLSARLQARLPELECEALTRAYSISDPADATDPTYREGLRSAVATALDYGLTGIEGADRKAPPIPVGLLAQARLAARSGIGLDTVLRRYCAGYSLFNDLLVSEAERTGGCRPAELKPLLRTLATRFDRLLAAVSDEYAREASAGLNTSEHHRAELVQRLLAGELFDLASLTAELTYSFECSHLGAIATGPGSAAAIEGLAASLDRRLLLVRREEGALWAWLGGRRGFDPDAVAPLLSSSLPAQTIIALGEPGEGLAGWRLTHRQAAAALPIALRGSRPIVRYADVALLASACQDDLLATSLRQLYLAPLQSERDGGQAARETLRAYFAAERNISSAAASLGIDRHTVTRRLNAIETRLGRSLGTFAADIEAALELGKLDHSAPAEAPPLDT